MANIQLTFAAGPYDFIRPITDGTVKVDGVDLTVLTSQGSAERHWRMARYHDSDICEFNVSAYFLGREQGFPYTAMPIFLHRRFRHGFVFVNTSKGIKEPKDMNGKRVGGTNYMPAANVWMRGILEEYYGVKHRTITWVTDRDDDLEFDHPADLKFERISNKTTLDAMLANGEIDAMISPGESQAFLKGDPRVARLWSNHKEIEIEYFKQTQIFPAMHATCIKQEIVDKYPWVPANLAKALEQAKAIAYRRIANPRMAALAWSMTALEEQQRILGRDPWEFGMTPRNRNNLETIQRYTMEQGMIKNIRPIDELFVDIDQGGIRERTGD